MEKKNKFLSIIKQLLFFQLINFIKCEIDNILSLTQNVRCIRFASNDNADRIIITSPSEDSLSKTKRILYGLKSNGRFYFQDVYNNEMDFKEFNTNTNLHKTNSESCFIYLSNGEENNGNQYLFSYGLGGSTVEIYDLKKPYSLSDDTANYYFLSATTSILSTIIRSSYITDSKVSYIFAFTSVTDNQINLFIFRHSFTSKQATDHPGRKTKLFLIGNRYSVTCYETENYIRICLYQNQDNILEIYLYNQITQNDIMKIPLTPEIFDSDCLLFF